MHALAHAMLQYEIDYTLSSDGTRCYCLFSLNEMPENENQPNMTSANQANISYYNNPISTATTKVDPSCPRLNLDDYGGMGYCANNASDRYERADLGIPSNRLKLTRQEQNLYDFGHKTSASRD